MGHKNASGMAHHQARGSSAAAKITAMYSAVPETLVSPAESSPDKSATPCNKENML
jgi:hypothetical protein